MNNKSSKKNKTKITTMLEKQSYFNALKFVYAESLHKITTVCKNH